MQGSIRKVFILKINGLIMKKFLIIFSILGFLLFSSFVSAFSDNPIYSNSEMRVIGSHTKDNTGYTGTDSITYEVNLDIHKGWNLLSGIPILDIKINSEIQKNDIYNFMYIKGEGKYMRVNDVNSFLSFLKNLFDFTRS